ncbi:MAG: hypothetical protein RL189_1002 [Pseudomonadota bacterium]
MTTDGLQNPSTVNSQSVNPVAPTMDVNTPSSVVARLEREMESLDAIGLKSFPWKADSENASSLVAAAIDVDWLIAQRELPYLVQILPPHLLYRSLLNHGVEDSLEVVEWLRGNALVRLLDYDLWTKTHSYGELVAADEQPSGERFLQWIKWWNEISPEFAAQRVMELDEGLLIGCMTSACEIIPVGLNRSQEELSDDYWITPDNRFGLKMKTFEQSDFEVFHQFIHALYKQNIRLAQSVLAHSAMLIREESVEEARRWRAGRMEDQGFVDADEARHMLIPKSSKQLADLIRIALRSESQNSSLTSATEMNEVATGASAAMDDDVREQLIDFLNSRDSDELAQEIENCLGTQEIVRLVGTSAPQSDILLQDEDVVDAFVERMGARVRQIVLNLEVQKARELRQRVRDDKSSLLLDQVMAWLGEESVEKVATYKTRIARTTNAVASALGAAHEPSELARVLLAVRGCLNIGLERLMADTDKFLPAEFSGMETAETDVQAVIRASKIFSAVGPEAVFQTGWQSLQDLAMDSLQMLVFTLSKGGKSESKISDEMLVTLSDGQQLKMSVLHLLSRGRYADVRKWLQALHINIDPALGHILHATLNRLPVFPIVLMEENATARASTAVRPYERLKEVEKTRLFFGRLPQMLDSMGQGE